MRGAGGAAAAGGGGQAVLRQAVLRQAGGGRQAATAKFQVNSKRKTVTLLQLCVALFYFV